ncbi:unnamed protein product, partial [Effrenium voratum]
LPLLREAGFAAGWAKRPRLCVGCLSFFRQPFREFVKSFCAALHLVLKRLFGNLADPSLRGLKAAERFTSAKF